MCLKHFEPFKCEFVPKDAVVLFCKKRMQLMIRVHDAFATYMLSDRPNRAKHEFYKSEIVKSIKSTNFTFIQL